MNEMKSLQLTIVAFCHLLLASLVFYFAVSLASGSPIVAGPSVGEPVPAGQQEQLKQQAAGGPLASLQEPAPTIRAAQPASAASKQVLEASAPVVAPAIVQLAHVAPAIPVSPPQVSASAPAASASGPASKLLEQRAEPAAVAKLGQAEQQKSEVKIVAGELDSAAKLEPQLTERKASEVTPKQKVAEQAEKRDEKLQEKLEPKSVAQVVGDKQPVVVSQVSQVAAQLPQAQALVVAQAASVAKSDDSAVQRQPGEPVADLLQIADGASAKKRPQVNGGLGPLHLLATTLCSYQPDRLVADDAINQLQARRAIVRKSLFDFMSLKFTKLEKLSSRLGTGLQVVPVKSVSDAASLAGSGAPGAAKPSHGWPVVGKCTAHDLKLMGEAAWCECQEGVQDCAKLQQDKKPASEASDKEAAKQQVAAKSARAIETIDSFSPEQSSVISKILHVSDTKEAPVIENNFYNLNLTQHQLATLEAQATSTLQCRRNALRYSKALFQHLAEDQQSPSSSWQQLYALISADDCARKRMIDIVNALSSFRTDTTSIRRDNVEFAFAMDDLRTKVLENEVNVPLTFDRHFIEVEQFLQQSVRLMLTSVQPKKAKLTSMRYRSLMYGPDFDDKQQCIDLHQRLLANNYPNDCNPMQFGQLPDVLRMTANSLELWSIEKELSLHLAKIADYPYITPIGQEAARENVNECIANLVTS